MEKAGELYEKVMAIDIKSLGADHPSMATTYNDVANLKQKQVGTRTCVMQLRAVISESRRGVIQK